MSERRNRTLLDMVRSMMSQVELPISFWGHVLETAAFTINRVPTKSVQKTPYEMWHGRKPSLSFMKIWGCDAYVKKLTSDKLAPKSEKCVFVGYPKETKGYYFYNRYENKVFVARNGTFLEKEFLRKGTSGSKIDLEEIREPEDNIEPMVETEPIPQSVEEPVQDTQIIRRSGRSRSGPERYGFLVT